MRGKFSLFLLLPELIFIILFGIFVDYDESSSGPRRGNGTTDSNSFNTLYPMFQDVHVMVFVGFGFLMTFLKRYGYGSVSFNLMIAVFVMQWAILLRGFLNVEGFADRKIALSLDSFLNADFAAASVLISYGAVLGVFNPIQLIVMAFLELVIYVLNEHIIIDLLQINDIGGSLVIHAFGAYFGLAASALHWRKELRNHPKEGSEYHSDIFAMIGTLFLWLYWPSFNASPAAGTMMGQRAVVTTLLSLTAATITTFALSSALDKSGKLSMVHIQNATLAGGVAVGSLANLKLGPPGAVMVGSFAGLLSVVGYKFITPALLKTLKIHDTCGVHNLHGMPGILSAMIAIVIARYTTINTFSSDELIAIYPGFEDDEWDFSYQAKMQLAGLGVTLGMSIFGGLLTGLILKLKFFEEKSTMSLFEDDDYWETTSKGNTETLRSGNGDNEMMVMEDRRSEGEIEHKMDDEERAFEDQSTFHQEKTPLTTAEND